MTCWLLKTEPDAFSLEDLRRRGEEPWDGIRNYQARNFLRSMMPGESIFIYHSRTSVPGIVGTACIASPARPDPTQFDPTSRYFDPASTRQAPRWDLVDVSYAGTFLEPVPLEILRKMEAFQDSLLIRKGNRLSVLPVTDAQWSAVMQRTRLV